jgi:preprotein translocase subunit SecE
VVSKTIGRWFEPSRPRKKIKDVSKFKEYINDTVTEMVHNVTWPTWKELQSSTIIVVVASVIISLFIFVMDFGFGIVGEKTSTWQGILGFIYRKF